MRARRTLSLGGWLLALIAAVATDFGCRAEAPCQPRPDEARGPEVSIVGMTVEQLGEHLKKKLDMSDQALTSVLGQSAYEIFAKPGDASAPRLVVAWACNEEGTPTVESFVFTRKPLPALTDSEAVIGFCEKLFLDKGAK